MCVCVCARGLPPRALSPDDDDDGDARSGIRQAQNCIAQLQAAARRRALTMPLPGCSVVVVSDGHRLPVAAAAATVACVAAASDVDGWTSREYDSSSVCAHAARETHYDAHKKSNARLILALYHTIRCDSSGLCNVHFRDSAREHALLLLSICCHRCCRKHQQ